MRQLIKTMQIHRALAMLLAILMFASMLPTPVYAEGENPGTVSTDIGAIDFKVGVATEFTITTDANDDVGTMVIGTAEFSDPGAIEKLEYLETKDNNWYPLTGDFGPSTGFPMMDATSTFRVTFNKAGIYSVNIHIKEASPAEGEEAKIICSTTATARVSSANSSLTTNIDQKTFVVGDDYTEFNFTTWATGDDAGKMVRRYFEFSDRDALDSLQYLEVSSGNYYDFYGDFGPESGFPLTDDTTSTFRAKFNKAGVYTVTAYMKDLDNKIICVCVANVTVKSSVDFGFEKDNIELQYGQTGVSNAVVDTVVGASYTYISNDESVVTVDSNGVLTPTGIGNTTIDVTRVETEDYVAATASYSVAVGIGTQAALTWVNTVPSSITVKDTYANTVTGGSGNGAVTYTSLNENVAEVNDRTGELTIHKADNVTIVATKASDGNYAAQTTTYTLKIVKATQESLVFAQSNPDAICVGDTFTNVATGGSTGGRIKYTSSNTDVATVDETTGEVTAIRVPMDYSNEVLVQITATLEGDEEYESVTAEYTITICRVKQKPSFKKGEVQTIVYEQEGYANVLENAETTVTYSSSNTDVATVDETTGVIKANKYGTTTITATVAQTVKYEGAVLTYTLNVERATQTVTFEKGTTNIPAIVYGQTYQNKASAKTDITYTSSNTDIATVDANGVVTPLKSGPVTITATAAETDQYASASEHYDITINKADQTISFQNNNKVITVTFNDNNNMFSNKATSNATENGESDIRVLYTIASGNDYAEINPVTGDLTIKGAGRIGVTVSFGNNERYNMNVASYELVVEKAPQTIAFEKPSYDMICSDNSFVAPTATAEEPRGTGKITYSIKGNADGVVSGIDETTGALTFTNKVGTVTIKATLAADNNYNEATATYTLTVNYATVAEGTTLYTLVGEQKRPDSGWFTGNVSVKVADGYSISYSCVEGEADWQDELKDAVTADGNFSVNFYVKDTASGKIFEIQTATGKKDATAPTAAIEQEKLSP